MLPPVVFEPPHREVTGVVGQLKSPSRRSSVSRRSVSSAACVRTKPRWTDALRRALDRLCGELELPDDALKIAAFHHPIHSPSEDRLRSSAFLDRPAQAGFSLGHSSDNTLFRYDRTLSGRRIEIVGAGIFGAREHELVLGIWPSPREMLHGNNGISTDRLAR